MNKSKVKQLTSIYNKKKNIKCNAVQIHRLKLDEKDNKLKTKSKMPHTNISKLIYVAPTPRNTPRRTINKAKRHISNPRTILQNCMFQNENFSGDEIEEDKFKENEHKGEKNIFLMKNSTEENIRDSVLVARGSKPEKYITKTSPLDINKKLIIDSNISTDNQKHDNNRRLSENQSQNIEYKEDNKQDNIKNEEKIRHSEEMRKLIKLQREKRKMEEKNSSMKQKDFPDREVIKKRLEELHKNSMKILEKNLKKAMKRTITPTKNELTSPTKTRKLQKEGTKIGNDFKIVNEPKKKVKSKKSNVAMEGEDTDIANNSKFRETTKEPKRKIGLLRRIINDETSSNNIEDYETQKENDIIESLMIPNMNLITSRLESGKQKTVTKRPNSSKDTFQMPCNNLDSNLQFENKENYPEVPRNNDFDNLGNQKRKSRNLFDFKSSKHMVHHAPKSTTRNQEKFQKSQPKSVDEFEYGEFETIASTETLKGAGNVANWLQTGSPADVYPYNFLTAIRKKIESVTNPTFQRSQIDGKDGNFKINTTKPTNCNSQEEEMHCYRIENAYTPHNTINEISSDSSVKQTYTPFKKIQIRKKIREPEKSYTLSEPISNFSSISIHVPESDTISEVSSLKSEVHLGKSIRNQESGENKNPSKNQRLVDEDTTISSSVFSRSEVGWQNVVDNISLKMQNEKKTTEHEFNKEHTTQQFCRNPYSQKRSENIQKENGFIGENLTIPNLKLEVNRNHSDSNKVNHSEKEISQFAKLLTDFNKSLSQVIEVNEQLKTTFDKSQKLLSPDQSEQSEKIASSSQNQSNKGISVSSLAKFSNSNEYESDFEEDVLNTTLTSEILEKDIMKTSSQKSENLISEEIDADKLQSNSSKENRRKSRIPIVSFEKEIQEKMKNLVNEKTTTNNLTSSVSEIYNTAQIQTITQSEKISEEDEKRSKSIKETIDQSQNEKQNSNSSKVHDFRTKKVTVVNKVKDDSDKTKSEKNEIIERYEKNKSKQSKDYDIMERKIHKNQEVKEYKASNLPQTEEIVTNNAFLKKSKLTEKHEKISDADNPLKPTQSLNPSKINNKNSIPNNCESLYITENVETMKNCEEESNGAKPKRGGRTQKHNKIETKSLLKSHHLDNVQEKSSNYSRPVENYQYLFSENGVTQDAKQNPIKSSTGNSVRLDLGSAVHQKSKIPEKTKMTFNNKKSDLKSSEETETDKVVESTIDEEFENFHYSSGDNNLAIWRAEFIQENSNLKNNTFIRNHVNLDRGDVYSKSLNSHFVKNRCLTNTVSSGRSVPSTYTVKESHSNIEFNSYESKHESNDIEFFIGRNKSDNEISMFLHEDNQSMTSEATLNYSSIGMYEQLLHAENLKSEQLVALLKIREKALIDRTKGQIALLEVQKEKLKGKGMFEEVSGVKKKQRALLLKMENKREEIKRLMLNQKTSTTSVNQTSPKHKSNPNQTPKFKSLPPHLTENISNITIRKGISTTSTTSTKIIRGIDIGPNQNLEKILQKREEELLNRRQHVEKLVAWHKRLDKEEQEVLQLEQMLLKSNRKTNVLFSSQNYATESESDALNFKKADILNHISIEEINKKDKKIAEIEQSLKSLQSISNKSQENTSKNNDHVRITGHKLNKLWTRLTGQKKIKFDSHRKYKFTKEDLEKFYEKAKFKVVEEFNKQHNISNLIEQSSLEKISSSTILEQQFEKLSNNTDILSINGIEVPTLELNFSTESDGESKPETSKENIVVMATNNNENNLELKDNCDEEKLLQNNSDLTKVECEKLQDNTAFEKSNIENKNDSTKFYSFDNSKTLNVILETEKSTNSNAEEISSMLSNKMLLTSPTTSKTDTNTENLSNNYLSSSGTFTDETYLIKAVPLDISSMNSPTGQSTPNTITEKISRKNSFSERDLTQEENTQSQSRPSVIVSLHQESHVFSSEINIENSESKSESTLIQNNFVISTKETPIVETTVHKDSSNNSISEKKSVKSIEHINIKKISSEQSTTESTNNSTKPPSSISLEMQQNSDQYKTTNNSLISTEKLIESIKQLDLEKQYSDISSEIPSELNEEEKNTNYSDTTIKTTESTEKNSNYDYSFNFENDFSGSDYTNIEDISMPKLDLTLNTTKTSIGNMDMSNFFEGNLEENQGSTSSTSRTELEKRLIDIDGSLKELNDTIEKALSPTPEKENVITEMNTNTNTNVTESVENTITASISSVSCTMQNNTISTKSNSSIQLVKDNLTNTVIQQQSTNSMEIKTTTETTKNTILTKTSTNDSDKITLMPDILNEVEIRRRQQILFENDIKQVDSAIPYVMLQGIPNKPPPPYVPPAHGSPMTTLFPTETRIKEIIFRRTAELYEEMLQKKGNLSPTKSSLPCNLDNKNSILNEKITNIYERIILDICKECMQEYEETFSDLNPDSYKHQLALYNPPDRLGCMQDLIYRRVRKLLTAEKTSNRKNSIFSINTKKRDYVDEILLQELYEEEHKWTNFDQEEEEVTASIIDEILNDVIKDVVVEAVKRNNNKDGNVVNQIVNENVSTLETRSEENNNEENK